MHVSWIHPEAHNVDHFLLGKSNNPMQLPIIDSNCIAIVTLIVQNRTLINEWRGAGAHVCVTLYEFVFKRSPLYKRMI